MQMEGIGQDSTAPAQSYRYNGKELEEATGLYDYGARYYDPAIARWGQVDPLADQYAPYSPYNYVLGNPIRLVDPSGMAPASGGPPVKIYALPGNPSKLDVGHVFVSVGEGANVTAYTYGRYAELGSNKGPLNATNLTGEGVLIKLEGQDAQDLINKYTDTYGASVYSIDNADADKVSNFFDNLLESSDKVPSVGSYAGDDRARVIDEYTLFGNNCTTLSVSGVEQGMPDGKLTYTDKVDHPKFKGEVTSNATRMSPTGLKSWLDDASKQNPNITKEN